jgi:hypothetical protein
VRQAVAKGVHKAMSKPEQDLEGLRQILLQVRDWGNGLAKQQFDDDPLPGMSPEKAEKAIMRLVQAEVAAARKDEHAQIIELGKRYGFERMATVVEYQDGTSADIPYRHIWNDCYNKFLVTSNARLAELHPPQQPPTEGGSE